MEGEYLSLDTAKKIAEKDKEIERLKELCDKYEEEHKTTFEEWEKTINIIKEVREYIEEQLKSYSLHGTIKDMRYIDFCKLLEILDKDNK